ncbi:unnamed protein product, partial [Brassica oleracea]
LNLIIILFWSTTFFFSTSIFFLLHLNLHPTTSTAAGSVSDSVSDLLLCGESTIHRHQVVTLAPLRLIFLVSSSSTSSIRWLVKLRCAFLCGLSSLLTVGYPNRGSIKPRRDLFLNQGSCICKTGPLAFNYLQFSPKS